MPSSNSSSARGSPLDSHSSGKYFSAMRVTCSSMSHWVALRTPGCLSTSRRVPQSPPPMITTRCGSAWVNSAGCAIISWYRKLSRAVSIIAPSISMRLPQSVEPKISIFWNGDCTSSSLPVMRKPIAEPVGSKGS